MGNKVDRMIRRDRASANASFLARIHAVRNGEDLQRLMKEVDAAKGISNKTFRKLHLAAEVRAKQLLAKVEQIRETVAVPKGDNVT